jgi:hypothetical protein
MLQEVIKECQAKEKFRLLRRSVEKVKAVFEACPPSLQINVNHRKIKDLMSSHQVQGCSSPPPDFEPATFNRADKKTQRLTTNEVSMLAEVIRTCQKNDKFSIDKSVDRVKAVFRACPPSLQHKLNPHKIKLYIKTFMDTQKELLKVQELSHGETATGEAPDISEPEDGGSGEEDGCISDTDEPPSSKGLTLEEAERKFKLKIGDWPVYTCSSCHEMHRASTLKPLTDLERIPEDAQATFIASNAPHAQYHANDWLFCSICRKHWGLGKIPPQSAFNEVNLPAMPAELAELS